MVSDMATESTVTLRTRTTTDRHESAPILPIEVQLHPNGWVTACYDGAPDQQYVTLGALCADHQVTLEDLLDSDDVARADAWVQTVPEIEIVTVTSVSVSFSKNDYVKSDVIVRVGDRGVACSVTLGPDPSRPTVGTRHPLGTLGDSVDAWADDATIAVLEDADAGEIEGISGRRELMSEICGAVDSAHRVAQRSFGGEG
jgi:hypothetical protein